MAHILVALFVVMVERSKNERCCHSRVYSVRLPKVHKKNKNILHHFVAQIKLQKVRDAYKILTFTFLAPCTYIYMLAVKITVVVVLVLKKFYFFGCV